MISFALPGGEIPAIGLGTWKINGKDQMTDTLRAAWEAGYRLIDTASSYSNEIVLSKALRELGARREELFIQDKLWNTNRGCEQAQEACRRSLRKLKLDYLDAYLIHWPASPVSDPQWEETNRDTWRGLEQLKKDGLVRWIGVCNFKPHHLKSLLENVSALPDLAQLEIHPGYWQAETLACYRDLGVHLQASSPLGNGQLLENGLLRAIGERKGKTPAQICLRWIYEKGISSIPKSTKPERLRQNLSIFDFSLTAEETAAIDALPFCGGLAIDADEVTDLEHLQ